MKNRRQAPLLKFSLPFQKHVVFLFSCFQSVVYIPEFQRVYVTFHLANSVLRHSSHSCTKIHCVKSNKELLSKPCHILSFFLGYFPPWFAVSHIPHLHLHQINTKPAKTMCSVHTTHPLRCTACHDIAENPFLSDPGKPLKGYL